MSDSLVSPFISRREFLKIAGATAGLAAVSPLAAACGGAAAPKAPLKVGVILPFVDIYAVLGESIRDAMKLYFESVNNEAGGRKIELVIEDTEMKPDVGLQKSRKLVEQDKVDLVTGIVSSGVAAAVRDFYDSTQTILIISNAGENSLTRAKKSKYIFRTSFTNWQPNWPLGKWAYENVAKKVFVSVPDYAAGKDMMNAFLNSFQAAGGEVVKTQFTPYPNMGDPAPFITDIKNSDPPMVFSFYSGGAAVTFVKAYAQFGLAGKIPLVGPGFLVESDVLPAQGDAALGIKNTMHWAPTLDTPENKKFMEDFKKKTGKDANVFAVQGFDTARVIVEAVNAVQGNTQDKEKFLEALRAVKFKGPRGDFRFDPKTQNVIQHIYLREVKKVDGTLTNVVIQDLGEVADPGDNSKG